jgi:tRNA-specific 2-thiouridylase
VDLARFQAHLDAPVGRGAAPDGSFSGAAGGAACGDLVRVSVAVEGERVAAATFDASGCGAALAAGSAAVALVDGRPLLEAARVGPDEVAGELGGLSPAKRHAAELAADALHRALGAAARAGAALAPVRGRVLVAMSGGVDSAVAAILCARRGDGAAAGDFSAADGYASAGRFAGGGAVLAVTLELWADPENDGERSCCSASAVRGARALAHSLGLPHLTLDLREEFRAGVVAPFLDDHAAGLTPNPCIRCNGHVRLDAMLDLARRLGAEALATGHYARVAADEHGPVLRAAADPAKDQSYMLAALAPDTLARMRFPLGDLTKPRVRELAAEAGLAVARRPDSQDLCFLAGTDRAAFLARHGGLRAREGAIVDRRGRVLGRHRGHHGYTVGQRKGIGVAAPEPLYVLATDAASNRVVVGSREELARRGVGVRGAVLHRDGARVDRVKLRYRSRPLPARLVGAPGAGRHARLEIALEEPVDGAAPGQTACLMDGDLVVGHATIAG